MVCFAGMPAMKWLVLLLVLFVANCSDNQSVFELAGKQFCIPKKYIIQNIPWVKADGRGVVEDKSKAIFNCFTIKLQNNSLAKSDCLFQPEEINSFVIKEDDGNRFGFGSPGYEKSTIGMVLTANDTTHTVADDGHLLVTENPRIVNNRFVWHRNVGLFSLGDKPTVGKDVLLFSCYDTTTGIGAPPGLSRPTVSCYRDFISENISIHYSFESTTPTPSSETISRFDQTIVDWLIQTECKNNQTEI